MVFSPTMIRSQMVPVYILHIRQTWQHTIIEMKANENDFKLKLVFLFFNVEILFIENLTIESCHINYYVCGAYFIHSFNLRNLYVFILMFVFIASIDKIDFILHLLLQLNKINKWKKRNQWKNRTNENKHTHTLTGDFRMIFNASF